MTLSASAKPWTFNKRDNRNIRVVILFILSAIFTTLCIDESTRRGRLASTANYDDTVYFLAGAILVQKIETHGPVAGIKIYLNERGLHSPYSVFMAAAAYSLLGFEDSSPYWANGLLVIVYLGCLGWLLRSLSLGVWTAALILFLTLPLITMGVVEFRPDIAWAVVTGFGVVLIITSDKVFSLRSYAFASGILLALSLLIKPSTFAMTVALYTGACVSRIIENLWSRRSRPRSPFPISGIVIFSLTTILVAGPYWLRFGQSAWAYFIENSFGFKKAIWVFQGSTKESLLFYINGQAAHSNIGNPGLLLSMIALGCAALLVIKKPVLRWKLFVLTALIISALIVNTTAPMKTAFLGGGIYGPWLFSCAYVINQVWLLLKSENKAGYAEWMAAMISIAAAASLVLYYWPPYSDQGFDKTKVANDKAAHLFIQSLLDEHEKVPPRSILFTQAGPIVMETAGMWFPAHNIETAVHWGAFISSEKEFRQKYSHHEWIIIQEQGVMGSSANMPAEALLPLFLKIIQVDSRYRCIGEFIARNDRKVWIYARKPL